MSTLANGQVDGKSYVLYIEVSHKLCSIDSATASIAV